MLNIYYFQDPHWLNSCLAVSLKKKKTKQISVCDPENKRKYNLIIQDFMELEIYVNPKDLPGFIQPISIFVDFKNAEYYQVSIYFKI